MTSAGRVFDGTSWTDVEEDATTSSIRGSQRPVPPVLDGDGKVHVAIASFRDGTRCAQTLIDLFANAKDPDNIVVGLVEQNYEDGDPFCLELYCQRASSDGKLEIYRRESIRKDTTKVIAKVPERSQCPRIDQIRKIAVHNIAAKGPGWARSLGRKVLGNEEFCLQIDAHSKFIPGWDAVLKEEWKAAENEFAVISHPPPRTSDFDKSVEEKVVPRNCAVDFLDIRVPHYSLGGDGKVENLKKPLLSHTWSPGFSFAKCHLEESAPYDGFTPYVAGAEAFSRYARFWTRGYDVYTPTRNIVYHNYNPNPDGHGLMEWDKPWKRRIKNKSLTRIRSFLEVTDADEGRLKLDNLGIYGLGKRRTLKQLNEFVGIDLAKQQSRPSNLPCANFHWVPYDTSISPIENLYNNPVDLDPQPEFPLRTELIFFKEEDIVMPDLEVLESDLHPVAHSDVGAKEAVGASVVTPSSPVNGNFPSFLTIFILWIIGLMAWLYFTINLKISPRKGRVKKSSNPGNFKDK
ncbi:glycosyltransferase GlcNAc [Nitzschia inconspicua]|uniref:Glycosyltransferase GlcNAc n=1 Tax=Nitzschia inconspicua TaxID=303405 RepID=A0A9K3Q5A9_9STRA|nr:glycosyltransferase GlcNAc [Nitzschia inconspicua]